MAQALPFERHPGNPILQTTDWPYPANAVFNAAAAVHEGQTVLMVRVEDLSGVSHLTLARSSDGFGGWQIDSAPTFSPSPDHPEEEWGVEDPRLTWIDELGCFVMTYTCYCQDGPAVSLARTKDLRTFERLGRVLCPENKDAALFPTRIKGQWAMIHRPVAGPKADMWVSYSPDLIHWGNHQVLLRARSGPHWDAGKVGLSAQPLQTSAGWLVLYHGVKHTVAGGIYRQGLALLDLEEPTRVLGRTPNWLFAPHEPWERAGDVDNVVFSCGWTLVGDQVRLYYAGADTCMAVATAPLQSLLELVQA